MRAFFATAIALAVAGPTFAQDQVKLSPWHDAVKKNDIAEVRRLLASGADVDALIDTIPPKSYRYANDPVPFVNGATALHIAAAQSSLEMVDLLLKAKAKVDIKDKDGRAPIYLAALRGDVPILERLYATGLKIDAKLDEYGETAVNLAAMRGKADAVKWLVEQGADVKSGYTPALFGAVRGHHFDLAEWLLKNGADLKQRMGPNSHPRNFTCMGIAVYSNDADAVVWLLKQGDDPLNPGDDSGDSPWRQTLNQYPSNSENRNGKLIEMLDAFIERCTPAQLDKLQALYTIMGKGLDKQAVRLLERGVDVNARDKDERTPLHAAVIMRQLAMVELLAKHKADLDAVDKAGWTPLMHATQHACMREYVVSGSIVGDRFGLGKRFGAEQAPKPIDFAEGHASEPAVKTLKLLLKLGADAQKGDARGCTPLHLATMIDNPSMLLLFAGLDTFGKGGHYVEGSATYWIHYHGYHGFDALGILLDGGAKVDVKLKSGLTPLDVANSPAARARVMKAGGKSSFSGRAAIVAANDLKGLRTYQGKDDINAASMGGLTPLTWAMVHRQDYLIPVLLKQGADAGKRDELGLTPLWLALSELRTDLITQFLANGASVDTPVSKQEIALIGHGTHVFAPKEGAKPIAVAADPNVRRVYYSSDLRGRLNVPLLKLLLAFDANANEVLDDEGRRPLHHAAASKDIEAVRMLLAAGADRTATDKEGKTARDHLPKDAVPELRELLK
jgi:ankyrin repeat protein